MRPNLLDWHRNVRVVLKQEKRLYVLESHIPRVPNKDTLIKVKTKYHCHIDDDEQIAYMMLASMSPELEI
jgi:hypothetical protein